MSRDPPGAKDLTLQCAGDAGTARGVHLAARFDEKGSGRIDWLNRGPSGIVRAAALTDASVRTAAGQSALHAVPMHRGLAARLPDGRLLASIEIRWPASAPAAKPPKPIEAQFEAIVIDDFALVQRAMQRLLVTQPAVFDDGPLVRANLMRALSSELGMPARKWCCANDADMPPPRVDVPELDASAVGHPALQPFFRHCAMCHPGHEQFPPNFLAGDAGRVTETLRQCAPRMLVRLSAWQTPADRRVKSPMPPQTVLPVLGTTPRQWAASDELEQLRAYLAALVRHDGQPAVAGQLPQGGYEALPACLPPAH